MPRKKPDAYDEAIPIILARTDSFLNFARNLPELKLLVDGIFPVQTLLRVLDVFGLHDEVKADRALERLCLSGEIGCGTVPNLIQDLYWLNPKEKRSAKKKTS